MKSRFCLVLSALIGFCALRSSAQTDWPQLGFTQAGAGASFPVQVTAPHDDSGRLFVVEQGGRILVYPARNAAPEVFLDIHNEVNFFFGGEEGLLCMAFSPGFRTNKTFYVFYTTIDPSEVLARFTVSSTSENRADAESEQILLSLPRVYTTVNSGQLAFGPDGYLYVGVGDTGFDEPDVNRAQDPLSLFGKILRLDVESAPGTYRVPPSNPFVGNASYAPEIWALGVRNPYRFSFDRANGNLYIGDVGQLTWEELDFQPGSSAGGENYGWPVREAKHPYEKSGVDLSRFKDPIYEVLHRTGPSAIIGGFVYRGPSVARMDGLYFFADFYSGRVFALSNPGASPEVVSVGKTSYFISSFGEDQTGNLLLSDYIAGKIYDISDNGKVAAPQFSPPAGTIYSNTVTLSTISPGARIRYTLDGSDPTEASPGVFSGTSIGISSGTTVKARAFRQDLAPSDVSAGAFTLRVAPPIFMPPQGPLAAGASVAMRSTTPGAIVRFTLDASDPDANSTLYSGPIPYDPARTIKARAFKGGFNDSSVATFSASGLRIDSIRIVDYFGESAMNWQSETGKNYQLEFSDDLRAWYELGGRLIGNGATLSYTNVQVYPSREMRHLRLKSWQD